MEDAVQVLVALCGPHSCPPLPVNGQKSIPSQCQEGGQGEEGFLCRGILACCSSLSSPPNHSRKVRSWYGSWRIPFPPPAFLGGVCVCVAQSCSTLCDPMEGPPLSMNSPGKNTRAGGHSLLQGIFPTQGSSLGLPHCRQILYHREAPCLP